MDEQDNAGELDLLLPQPAVRVYAVGALVFSDNPAESSAIRTAAFYNHASEADHIPNGLTIACGDNCNADYSSRRAGTRSSQQIADCSFALTPAGSPVD